MYLTHPNNTTARIQAHSAYWRGSHSFLHVVSRNNPHCSQHWLACITNNPGGCVPNLNPTWLEEKIDQCAAMVA